MTGWTALIVTTVAPLLGTALVAVLLGFWVGRGSSRRAERKRVAAAAAAIPGPREERDARPLPPSAPDAFAPQPEAAASEGTAPFARAAFPVPSEREAAPAPDLPLEPTAFESDPLASDDPEPLPTDPAEADEPEAAEEVAAEPSRPLARRWPGLDARTARGSATGPLDAPPPFPQLSPAALGEPAPLAPAETDGDDERPEPGGQAEPAPPPAEARTPEEPQAPAAPAESAGDEPPEAGDAGDAERTARAEAAEASDQTEPDEQTEPSSLAAAQRTIAALTEQIQVVTKQHTIEFGRLESGALTALEETIAASQEREQDLAARLETALADGERKRDELELLRSRADALQASLAQRDERLAELHQRLSEMEAPEP